MFPKNTSLTINRKTNCKTRILVYLLKILLGNLVFIIIGVLIGYGCSTKLPNEESIIVNLVENKTKEADINFLPEDDTSLADDLFDNVKVLCWVKTYPGNEEQVKATINTWGKRCNKLIFFSSINDSETNTIGLNVPEGRENLWTKVRLAYQYIYDNYLDEFDWFLKVDDDTYVIMENLRYMLSEYSPEHPYYIGGRINVSYYVSSFMSGGAGYVISRAALKYVVEDSFPYPNLCPDMPVDDITIAVCLNNINVTFVDSRDAGGNERFFPFEVEYHLFPLDKEFNWYARDKHYEHREGIGNLTRYPISFHYIRSNLKYSYDYLLYEIRAYGRQIIQPPLPNTVLDKNYKSKIKFFQRI